MSTCKDCHWVEPMGNESGLCALNPPIYVQVGPNEYAWCQAYIDNINQCRCSHLRPREESPGTITLTRAVNGEAIITNYHENNHEMFEWMRANMERGTNRTFRLEPVEEES